MLTPKNFFFLPENNSLLPHKKYFGPQKCYRTKYFTKQKNCLQQKLFITPWKLFIPENLCFLHQNILTSKKLFTPPPTKNCTTPTEKTISANIYTQYMKVFYMAVTNVIMKPDSNLIWVAIHSQYMKVLNMDVTNVIFKPQRKAISAIIYIQYMKALYMAVTNMIIKPHSNMFWADINSPYMKVLNMPVIMWLWIRWKRHLSHHILMKHDGVIYGCNQCDYKTTQQCILSHHKQLIHNAL